MEAFLGRDIHAEVNGKEKGWEMKKRTCSPAVCSAESCVFTLECQQVKVGDNAV